MNERIKELRKALDLNQTEFGNRIGIKQGTVTGYETGNRTPTDAVILSKKTGPCANRSQPTHQSCPKMCTI